MTSKIDIKAHGDRQIVIRRTFTAPPPLIFEALTVPALLKRWLTGPDGWSLDVCEIDLQIGGAYRYEWVQADGTRLGMGGIYKEIAAPSRIVQTERYDEDWTGGETLSSAALLPVSDGTLLTTTIEYSSSKARDRAFESGMAGGVAASHTKLDALLQARLFERAS